MVLAAGLPPFLCSLCLRDCAKVTDGNVQTVLLCKPPLVRLDLGGCIEVGPLTAQGLRMAGGSIEHLSLTGDA